MSDAREIIALQEFAKWAIKEGAFLAADLDCLSIQEKAHELGLIEATAYDPEKHGPSDVAETGDEWFTFSPILTADGFRILGPDEVDAVTLEEVEAQAEQIMLDVANEWHRQIGIDEVLKSKLVKRIADTVATGVFSRALRALASGESR